MQDQGEGELFNLSCFSCLGKCRLTNPGGDLLVGKSGIGLSGLKGRINDKFEQPALDVT
jgi:hypothetical protein